MRAVGGCSDGYQSLSDFSADVPVLRLLVLRFGFIELNLSTSSSKLYLYNHVTFLKVSHFEFSTPSV